MLSRGSQRNKKTVYLKYNHKSTLKSYLSFKLKLLKRMTRVSVAKREHVFLKLYIIEIRTINRASVFNQKACFRYIATINQLFVAVV